MKVAMREEKGDPRAGPEVQVHVPFPQARQRTVSHFRTTWLASSLQAVSERGLLDRYRAELDPAYHDIILNTVAAQWAPIEVALHHYEACDRLGISPLELSAIGRQVAHRVHGSLLSTIVKLARGGGVTPWTALLQVNRLWEKVWNGGGVCVYRLGPKDAIVEIAGWPIADKAYIRGTTPGVVEGVISLFCRRAFAKPLPKLCTSSSVVVEVQWA